jgi:hypothetical protein
MSIKKTWGFTLCFMAIATMGLAQVVPDMDLCEVRLPQAGESVPIMLVNPRGDGYPFTRALSEEGLWIDATLELTLLDSSGQPISGVPRQDVWLSSPGGTFQSCLQGSTPEADSDANGRMYWEGPINAGGVNEGVLDVVVNGSVVRGPGTPLRFHVVSSDLDGDGGVALDDAGAFAEFFHGEYHIWADMTRDGMVNLADVGIFADGYIGGNCPF